MRSLQPTIRSGQGADLTAVLALLQAAGLPTADLRRAQDLHLWVLEYDDSLCGGAVCMSKSLIPSSLEARHG
jgi:hypothetical protein